MIKKEEFKTKTIKIIAEENGKRLGQAYLYIMYNDSHAEPYGYFADLLVDPEFRGRGIGTSLVREVIAEAKAHGCYKLVCTSRDENEVVHKLYTKLGFRDYGSAFRLDFNI